MRKIEASPLSRKIYFAMDGVGFGQIDLGEAERLVEVLQKAIKDSKAAIGDGPGSCPACGARVPIT